MSLISASTLGTIHQALKSGKPFEISETGTVHPMSLSSRIWHGNDKHFHLERKAKIATLFAKHLSSLPREEPSKTLDNDIILMTRKFLKTVTKEEAAQDPNIRACKRELLAYRIGICCDVFEYTINEGFEKFASNPPLDRYLAAYNHKIVISDDGNIQLRKGDRYLSWSELKREIVPLPRDPATNQPWFYGPNGIQNTNMFEWTELKPYKIDDPAKWDHKNLFVICVCCGDKHPNFVGDHTWMEFWKSDGSIISVGLYRPYKHKPEQAYNDPLRLQQGKLMQPDVSRFWPDTAIHEIPFEITEEQLTKIIKAIERDKKEDNLVFQLNERNCTKYALDKAEMAGIQIPTKKPFWELLCKRYGHPIIPRVVKAVSSRLPDTMTKAVSSLTTGILNLPLLAAGAGKVDKSIPKGVHQPHLVTWKTVFDPEKQMVSHPFTLGNDTRKLVKEWRRTQPEKFRFAPPPPLSLK